MLFFARIRSYTPTLIGAALLSLPLDGLILFFRLIGLSRPTAVYAGLLTFVTLSSLIAQRYFRPRKPKRSGEDNNA